MRNVVINVIMRDRVSRQMGALARSTAVTRNQFNELSKSTTVLSSRLNTADRRVKEIHRSLVALSKVRPSININVREAEALASIRRVSAASRELSGTVISIRASADTTMARAQLAQLINQRRVINIRVNVDQASITRATGAIRAMGNQSTVTSRLMTTNFMRARQSISAFVRSFDVLHGRGMAWMRLSILLGPIAAGAFAVATRGILQAVSALGTAALGAGVFALAMRNVIKTNTAAQAQVNRLKAAFNSFGLGSSRIITQVLTVSVSALINILKALEPAVRPLSGVFLSIAREIEAATRSPGMARFSNWFRVAAPAAVTSLWGTIKVFSRALFTTLSKIGAFNGTAFLNWLNRCAHAFNTWANSGGPERLKAFMDQWGPAIARAASGLFQLAFAIGGALNPVLVVLVGWLGTFSMWLAKLINQHPVLGQVLAGVIVGFKLLGVVVPLVSTAYKILTSNIFRNTMAWVLNKAAVLSHKAANAGAAILSAVRWLGAQTAALIRNTGAWVANRAQIIAHRVANIASVIVGVIGALAAQGAALIRNTALWIANRVAMVASVVWFGVLRAATLAYTAAMWLLNIAMRANPFILIVTLLIALGVALVVAYRKSETFRNIVNAAFNAVRTAAMFLWNGIQIAFNFIWNLIKTVWNWIRTNWPLLGKILLIAFTGPIGLIIVLIIQFRGFIIAAFNAIRNGIVAAWRATWNLVRTIFNSAWNAIRASFNAIRNGLVAGFNFLRNGIVVAWRATWNLVRSVFNTAWNAIRSSFNAIRNSLVAGFNFLRNGIVTVWRATWNIVRSVFNTAWNAIRSSMNAIRNALVAAFNFIRNGIVTVWQATWNVVRAVFNAAWNAIRASLNAIRSALVAAFNAIRSGVLAVWNAFWNAMRTVFNVAWNAIRTTIGTIRGFMVGAFNAIRNGVVSAWNFMWNSIRGIMNSAWGAVRGTFNVLRSTITSIIRAVSSVVTNTWGAMWNRTRELFNAAWSAIRNTFNVVRNTIGSIVRAISSFFTNTWGAMWARIRQVFNSAWSAIRNTFNVMSNTIGNIVRAISSFFTNTWGRMWARIRQLFNSAWSAIRNTFNVVSRTIGNIVSAISAFFTVTWGRMWARVRQLFNAAWSAIRNTFNVVSRTIARIVQAISTFFTNVWGRMWARIRQLFNAAWSAIRNTFNVVARTISNIVRSISSFFTNAWGRMWARIRELFNNAWGAIRNTFNVMAKTLARIWDGIVKTAARVWEAIKGAIARPINFVIGFVADRLIPMANKAMSLVLGKKAPQINAKAVGDYKIPGYAEGGVVKEGFAAGGVLKGYSPGRDNMIGNTPWGPVGLSGGEGILRPEVMRAPGMMDLLHSANHAAIRGGVSAVKRRISDTSRRNTDPTGQRMYTGRYPGFAKGGVVGGVPVAANYDVGGFIKDAVGKLVNFTPIGAIKMTKDAIVDKGFHVLADKVLGKIYNNMLSFFKDYGAAGGLVSGIMEKVVGTIVNWIVDKTSGGFGGVGSGKWGDMTKYTIWRQQIWYPGKSPRKMSDRGSPTQNHMDHVHWLANKGTGSIGQWGVHQNVAAVGREIQKKFGVKTIGGYRQDPYPDHPSRKCLDIMTPDYPSFKTGDAINKALVGKGGGGGMEEPKSSGKGLLAFSGTGAGGGAMSGGGKAYFTHFWDSFQPTASGRKMDRRTIASSYIPLGSKLTVGYKNKSLQGTIWDLGPAKFVYDRHPGIAVLDLATPMMKDLTGGTNNVFGQFKIDKVGSGRTLYGKRLRGYATGGMMSPGELAVVGERGPELFQAGNRGGTVHPNAVAGGAEVTFNNCTFVGGNQRQMEDAVVHAIREAERKGRIRRNRG